MRINYLVLTLCVVSTINIHAQQMDVEEVKLAAADFMNKQPVSQIAKSRGNSVGRKIEARNLKLADSRLDEKNVPALYVFNMPDNQGYVIASAEKNAEPILGYSHVGNYQPDNLPCCLKYLLDNYTRQIFYAREHPSKMRQKKVSTRANERNPISPLITSRWGQGTPYNDYCPELNGYKCATGCVATAMAQVLYYHRWPERGRGSHGYNWNGTFLQADFGNTDYHFEKMVDVYDFRSNYSVESTQYVAQLMYHCGVSVNMGYGVGESTGNVYGYEFPDYFRYSKGYWNISVENSNLESVLSKIYYELSQKRPLLISGHSKDSMEGHEFICDGYAQDGFLHFNFGWEGFLDNYFNITAINPDDDYSFQQNIIGGLIPMKDVEEVDMDGFHYEFHDGKAFLVDGSEAKGDLTIPSTVMCNGKMCEVTTICSKAFKNNNNINSVTIPSCVEIVSDSIFAGCRSLKKLIIEDSDMPLTESMNSFEGLSGILENVYLGRDCNADFGLGSLKALTIGAGVREKSWWLNNISSANKLETIDVVPENGFFSVENGVLFDKNKTKLIAYLRNNKQVTYTIPSTVISIDSLAFSQTQNLLSIDIPASVERIAPNAFHFCDFLKEFSVDKENRHFIFEDKTLLSYDKTRLLIHPDKHLNEKVVYEMPNSVTNVDDYAFKNVIFSSITLSENLESLGQGAFMGTGSKELKTLYLPSSLKSIGACCFEGLSADAIYVDKNNRYYTDINGVLVDKSKSNLICMPSGRTGAYAIPESIRHIESNAFDYSSLSSLYIPATVAFISNFAFLSPQIDSLIVNSSEPLYCDWGALYGFMKPGSDAQPKVFVPVGSIPLYRTTNPWFIMSDYYEMGQDEMSKWLLTNDIRETLISSKPHAREYYDLRGNRLPNPRPGINIIRTDDGKYKKVLIKMN